MVSASGEASVTRRNVEFEELGGSSCTLHCTVQCTVVMCYKPYRVDQTCSTTT